MTPLEEQVDSRVDAVQVHQNNSTPEDGLCQKDNIPGFHLYVPEYKVEWWLESDDEYTVMYRNTAMNKDLSFNCRVGWFRN